MATAVLVNRDLEIGRRILAALTRARIAVNVAFWAYVPSIDEWQLYISTPLVDSKGPKSAYEQVLKALQGDEFGDLPWRRLFLRSPKEPDLRAFEKNSRTAPQEVFRPVREQIAGSFVDDVYVYGGLIDIAEIKKPDRSGHGEYRIVYAPYSGSGGALKHQTVKTLEELAEFLENRVRVRPSEIEQTISHLRHYGWANIPNVMLKASDLRRLELA